jgi:diacylglycerol kinase
MESNSNSPIVTGWPARFRCSIDGIGVVFRTQDSARIQAIAAVAIVALGLELQVSIAEWCALVLAMTLVLTAEALNTSIESTIDLVSPEFHELAGRAKDVAAGAVLIAALGSVAVGLLVFVPHLWG